MGKLRPGGHRWPGELLIPACRDSHSFLQNPNEDGRRLDLLSKQVQTRPSPSMLTLKKVGPNLTWSLKMMM